MEVVGLLSASFHVRAHGRVVLPVEVRRSAGIDEGSELIASVIGPGRALVEARAAVRARVWDTAPEPVGLDATADIRDLRTEDNAIADANSSARSMPVVGGIAGAQLLADLGLA